MDEGRKTEPEEFVNVEEIMQAIRQQILAKKEGEGSPVGRLQGKFLPPDFYEHLYQAGLAYDQIKPKLYLTPVSIPLFGPIVQQLRHKFHELVLFYVNQLAADQIRTNTHLLRAISILGEEFERMKDESSG